jgi:hypothetical protein
MHPRTRLQVPPAEPARDSKWGIALVLVRGETPPVGLQLFSERADALDDRVLQHRHPAEAIEVGICIALFRFDIGGSTGVAKAPPQKQEGRLPLTIRRRGSGGVVSTYSIWRKPSSRSRPALHELFITTIPHMEVRSGPQREEGLKFVRS